MDVSKFVKENLRFYIDGDNTTVVIKNELYVKVDTINLMRLDGNKIIVVSQKIPYTIMFDDAKNAKELFEEIMNALFRKIPRIKSSRITPLNSVEKCDE